MTIEDLKVALTYGLGGSKVHMAALELIDDVIALREKLKDTALSLDDEDNKAGQLKAKCCREIAEEIESWHY